MLHWLIPTILVPIGLYLFQHWHGSRARGTQDDPLPLSHRPRGPLVPSVSEDLDLDALRETILDLTGMTPAQAVPLLAQIVLSNPDGRLWNQSPVRALADQEWIGPWAALPTPSEEGGHPRWRWRAVRSYPSLRMGVADWLHTLPVEAVAALRDGNVAEYALRLARSGHISLDPRTYAAYLSETAAQWLHEGPSP